MLLDEDFTTVDADLIFARVKTRWAVFRGRRIGTLLQLCDESLGILTRSAGCRVSVAWLINARSYMGYIQYFQLTTAPGAASAEVGFYHAWSTSKFVT